LQYLFDDAQFRAPLGGEQRQLSEQMIRYWSNFARTGNPNGAHAPAWHPFSGDSVQSLQTTGIRAVNLGSEHHCGFWRSLA